jgi:23S rRNA pseudouridine2605 synthase
MRLNKYLAHCGVASRRQCDAIIFEKRVAVNETIIDAPGTEIDPEKDIITVDGEKVRLIKHFTYIKLQKPQGYVSTKKDPHADQTVMDLLPKPYQHLVPIGRLDKDTTGILLFTDDGDLVHTLIHPRYEVEKQYLVQLAVAPAGFPEEELPKGVALEEKAIAKGQAIPLNGKRTLYRIILKEGKKREVKRIFRHYNTKVRKLHRELFAGITADDLAPGDWKKLTSDEINKLKEQSTAREFPQKRRHRSQNKLAQHHKSKNDVQK